MSTDAHGQASQSAAAAKAATAATAGAVLFSAREGRSLDDRLTMLVSRMTYVALSVFFACFYFADLYLQLINQHGSWKPAGVDHPATWLGVSEAAFVLAAGLLYFWGQRAGLDRRNWNVLTVGLWGASLLTILAIVPHIVELRAPGFRLQDGAYVSVFISLESVFTVLLIITATVLLGVANRARLGMFRESGTAVEAFGEYLGWVSAIALLNFLALYVQPFLPGV
jgi:hypothetical protein